MKEQVVYRYSPDQQQLISRWCRERIGPKQHPTISPEGKWTFRLTPVGYGTAVTMKFEKEQHLTLFLLAWSCLTTYNSLDDYYQSQIAYPKEPI